MDFACIYCGLPGAITAGAVYVCSDVVCRKKYMVEPDNNAVTLLFAKNAQELQFLVKISFAAVNSNRKDMIFNPFPWMFKFGPEQFTDDILGAPALKNRDYELLSQCVHCILIDDLFNIIAGVDSDKSLIEQLVNINQKCGKLLYQFIKFIIETKKIETEYCELAIKKDNNSLIYKQFKIKHDPTVESNFNKTSNEFCYLFHGSSVENWHSIIRNGIFNASGTKLMTAGAAYGNGVYLSDNLAINSHYARGNLESAAVNVNSSQCLRRSDMIVAVFQVASAKELYRKAIGVYVVPDSSKLLIRYLISVPVSAELETLSTELEQIYNRIHSSETKMVAKVNSRSKMRIDRDLKQAQNLPGFNSITQINDSEYSLSIKVRDFTLCLCIKFTPEYPFESPVLYILSPIVSSTYVLCSGAVSMSELLKKNWKPITSLNTIIEKIINNIEFICDEMYDPAAALKEATLIK
ncbi:Poly-(ADP-ribose) polymerase with ubiquitin-conjugating enzyme/RWD-like [Pacmanvirus A23]|uniref:Poly-(ADP-ribose) polymerase with ubiquitin-conjugating enzyme/RWD-like n=1 Tax=Pacmanvirus A23 TaxID=1932881 RepID=UPI000A093DDF|nr:Poly-(ADP-ribose) polymerase with ubiquitin-conjugating enzyme/RWD-like [Pacmanvirus A23]SIP85984.1 Poly-(ADP-ribose) polymerase with ubiquitin-conjugating enzyme/RWD-like [Pacmanvirus A23]